MSFTIHPALLLFLERQPDLCTIKRLIEKGSVVVVSSKTIYSGIRILILRGWLKYVLPVKVLIRFTTLKHRNFTFLQFILNIVFRRLTTISRSKSSFKERTISLKIIIYYILEKVYDTHLFSFRKMTSFSFGN